MIKFRNYLDTAEENKNIEKKAAKKQAGFSGYTILWGLVSFEGVLQIEA